MSDVTGISFPIFKNISFSSIYYMNQTPACYFKKRQTVGSVLRRLERHSAYVFIEMYINDVLPHVCCDLLRMYKLKAFLCRFSHSTCVFLHVLCNSTLRSSQIFTNKLFVFITYTLVYNVTESRQAKKLSMPCH